MKTALPRQQHTIDAGETTLGRLATTVAHLLRGKHKPQFSFNQDVGDFVTIKNLSKLNVSGKKQSQKLYRRHSGYLGNMKTLTFQQLFSKDPKKILVHAVSTMLPNNRLRPLFLKRLKFEE